MASKKADTCPSCRTKLGVGKKFFGGLIGGILSLMLVGMLALTYIGMVSSWQQKTEDQLRKELMERCNEESKSAPQGFDKKIFAIVAFKVD